MNIFRVSLHPDGLAARTRNFDDWAIYLLTQLRHSVVVTADPVLRDLHAEVPSYPNVIELVSRPGWSQPQETPLLVPCRLDLGGVELSLFTTLTTFGMPRDVTLDELVVERFFPADDQADQLLRSAERHR
jgi:hypothetical protein